MGRARVISYKPRWYWNKSRILRGFSSDFQKNSATNRRIRDDPHVLGEIYAKIDELGFIAIYRNPENDDLFMK